MIVRRHFPVNAEFLIPLAAHSRRDSICWGGKKGVATIFDDLQT